MTVFILAMGYGILTAGSLILLVRNAYIGWTWFFKNYDDLPHIYRSRWRYQRRFILKRLWKRLFNRLDGYPAASPVRPASTDSTRW